MFVSPNLSNFFDKKTSDENIILSSKKNSNITQPINFSKVIKLYFQKMNMPLDVCKYKPEDSIINVAHITFISSKPTIECYYGDMYSYFSNLWILKEDEHVYKNVIFNCNSKAAFEIDDALEKNNDSCAVRGMEENIPDLQNYYFFSFVCYEEKLNKTRLNILKNTTCYREISEYNENLSLKYYAPFVFDPETNRIYK
jgi:hypothetical protein